MKLVRIWQRVSFVAIVFACWLVAETAALAAPVHLVAQGGIDTSQAWVVPYAILCLLVGLGMLVVCRSSGRTDRAKPKEYQSLTNAT